MSWITDAQHQAKELRTKKKDETPKKTWGEQELENFHEVTCQTKIGIENLLLVARQQGLLVSNAFEGYWWDTDRGIGCLGNFRRHQVKGTPNEPDPANEFASYVIYWKITEPKTNKTTTIRLGMDHSENYTEIEKVKNKLFFVTWETKREKHFYGKPTTKPSEVEIGIKNWLVEVYSK